ncbi:hypothetical protein L914_07751 [Phytophthora nicotianae]|uniref:Uncharacterized protein n=1 Tax=Phytophthora nicotianae TaxID=4792 RepID=W2NFX1_PHYNI|nr:hypothetical protein L914_07751 [Phytophthora nicotianae]
MVACCTSLRTELLAVQLPTRCLLPRFSGVASFFSVSRRVVKLAGLLLVADGAEMSLPTNGGTDRDAFGSVAALPFSSLPHPPSYSISRTQIVANGLSRKRSRSGESLPSQSNGTPPRVAFAEPRMSFTRLPPSSSLGGASPTVSTARDSTRTTATLPSLRFQLPAPPPAKRLRREPLSPTSVGEVSDAKKMPSAKSAVATTPGATQMQSILRGLQHLSACEARGCSNPLCVSTRAFVDKVKAHRSNMARRGAHDADRCGACKLWGAIVRAHTPTCSAGSMCRVPGCPSSQ